jgi:hypothetical protein
MEDHGKILTGRGGIGGNSRKTLEIRERYREIWGRYMGSGKKYRDIRKEDKKYLRR